MEIRSRFFVPEDADGIFRVNQLGADIFEQIAADLILVRVGQGVRCAGIDYELGVLTVRWFIEQGVCLDGGWLMFSCFAGLACRDRSRGTVAGYPFIKLSARRIARKWREGDRHKKMLASFLVSPRLRE